MCSTKNQPYPSYTACNIYYLTYLWMPFCLIITYIMQDIFSSNNYTPESSLHPIIMAMQNLVYFNIQDP